MRTFQFLADFGGRLWYTEMTECLLHTVRCGGMPMNQEDKLVRARRQNNGSRTYPKQLQLVGSYPTPTPHDLGGLPDHGGSFLPHPLPGAVS